MELFSSNSKFFQFMSRAADCLILSVLWLLMCVPVVTAGAATTALYFSAVKVLRQNDAPPVKTFFATFRSNFRQSTLVTVIALVITLLVVGIGSFICGNDPTEDTREAVNLAYLLAAGIGSAWLHYLFSYIARFDAPFGRVVLNSFLIAIVNLPKSVMMVLLFAVAVMLIVLLFPVSVILLLFLPALYALVCSFILEGIYRQFIPKTEEE